MSAPKKNSALAGIHAGLCKQYVELLKGEPVRDEDGHVVMLNGEPLMQIPTAAHLKEVREFLKDNGIDEEPTEGSEVMNVAKAIRKYDDAPDPFLLETT
jgi:hypothetical protein